MSSHPRRKKSRRHAQTPRRPDSHVALEAASAKKPYMVDDDTHQEKTFTFELTQKLILSLRGDPQECPIYYAHPEDSWDIVLTGHDLEDERHFGIHPQSNSRPSVIARVVNKPMKDDVEQTFYGPVWDAFEAALEASNHSKQSRRSTWRAVYPPYHRALFSTDDGLLRNLLLPTMRVVKALLKLIDLESVVPPGSTDKVSQKEPLQPSFDIAGSSLQQNKPNSTRCTHDQSDLYIIAVWVNQGNQQAANDNDDGGGGGTSGSASAASSASATPVSEEDTTGLATPDPSSSTAGTSSITLDDHPNMASATQAKRIRRVLVVTELKGWLTRAELLYLQRRHSPEHFGELPHGTTRADAAFEQLARQAIEANALMGILTNGEDSIVFERDLEHDSLRLQQYQECIAPDQPAATPPGSTRSASLESDFDLPSGEVLEATLGDRYDYDEGTEESSCDDEDAASECRQSQGDDNASEQGAPLASSRGYDMRARPRVPLKNRWRRDLIWKSWDVGFTHPFQRINPPEEGFRSDNPANFWVALIMYAYDLFKKRNNIQRYRRLDDANVDKVYLPSKNFRGRRCPCKASQAALSALDVPLLGHPMDGYLLPPPESILELLQEVVPNKAAAESRGGLGKPGSAGDAHILIAFGDWPPSPSGTASQGPRLPATATRSYVLIAAADDPRKGLTSLAYTGTLYIYASAIKAEEAETQDPSAIKNLVQTLLQVYNPNNNKPDDDQATPSLHYIYRARSHVGSYILGLIPSGDDHFEAHCVVLKLPGVASPDQGEEESASSSSSPRPHWYCSRNLCDVDLRPTYAHSEEPDMQGLAVAAYLAQVAATFDREDRALSTLAHQADATIGQPTSATIGQPTSAVLTELLSLRLSSRATPEVIARYWPHLQSRLLKLIKRPYRVVSHAGPSISELLKVAAAQAHRDPGTKAGSDISPHAHAAIKASQAVEPENADAVFNYLQTASIKLEDVQAEAESRLGTLHRCGIIHQDIHPANLCLRLVWQRVSDPLLLEAHNAIIIVKDKDHQATIAALSSHPARASTPKARLRHSDPSRPSAKEVRQDGFDQYGTLLMRRVASDPLKGREMVSQDQFDVVDSTATATGLTSQDDSDMDVGPPVTSQPANTGHIEAANLGLSTLHINHRSEELGLYLERSTGEAKSHGRYGTRILGWKSPSSRSSSPSTTSDSDARFCPCADNFNSHALTSASPSVSASGSSLVTSSQASGASRPATAGGVNNGQCENPQQQQQPPWAVWPALQVSLIDLGHSMLFNPSASLEAARGLGQAPSRGGRRARKQSDPVYMGKCIKKDLSDLGKVFAELQRALVGQGEEGESEDEDESGWDTWRRRD